MARLKVNVYVVDPSTDAPVLVMAGSDLPKWAEGVVGGHALEDVKPDGEAAPETAKKPARRRSRG